MLNSVISEDPIKSRLGSYNPQELKMSRAERLNSKTKSLFGPPVKRRNRSRDLGGSIERKWFTGFFKCPVIDEVHEEEKSK